MNRHGSEGEDRAERLAAALRANLRRRKEQARGRREAQSVASRPETNADAEEPDGDASH